MTGFPWAELSTEISLCALGLALLLLDIAIIEPGRKHVVGYAALGGLVLCLVPAAGVCVGGGGQEALFGGLYRTDSFQTFFRLLAVVVGVLVTLISFDYLEHIRMDRGVYFALLVFAVLGVVLLAGAGDLVMIYLAIEYLSIVSYILAAYLLGRDKAALGEVKRSNEAGLKYLIFGAVASAVMLYGFSLMYGLAGSTSLEAVARAFGDGQNLLVKLLAAAMAMVGLGFKVAAVPFHQWAPDVYEGAPTPVAAFLAVGSKAGAFAVLTRFLVSGLGAYQTEWGALLAVIATITMFAGNLLAILQGNIKRMLGYSSVAHAGYMLVGVVANTPEHLGVQAVLIYLGAYLFMTLGAFAVVVWYQRSSGSERIDDYRGLATSAPAVAAAMLIFMLSLTGIPPTAGFVGKLFLLRAAIASPGHWWLGVVIIVNSVISAFYYMNVVRVMYYLPPPPGLRLRPAFCSPVAIAVCAVATVLLCVQFGGLLDLSRGPLGAFIG